MVTVALREPDGLAGPLTKEIEFCAPCFATSNRLYINNIWRMKRENSLHAFAGHDTPHCESFVNSASFAGNNGAGKYLRSCFVTLFDAAMDIHHIAYLKVRNVLPETLALNGI